MLLSFRPLAWTLVCRDQMKALDIHHQRLEDLNTVALGIGVDSAPSNKAWAESMAVTQTKLLADFWPHGEVARKYGVFRQDDGFAERANIIVDENQKVVFVKVYPTVGASRPGRNNQVSERLVSGCVVKRYMRAARRWLVCLPPKRLHAIPAAGGQHFDP